MDERKSPMYLKCIEYSCLLDIVFKLLSIVLNKHFLLQAIIYEKNSKCGRLFNIDNYIYIGLKLFSIMVMLMGLVACIKEDLYEFNRFRGMMFNFYLFLELLAVLGISFEITFFKCSKLDFKHRILNSVYMLVVGITILSIYFSLWYYFSNNALHYLQTKNNKGYNDEISHGENQKNYDTFGDDTSKVAPSMSIKPENMPIKTSLIEFQNLEDSDNRIL